MSRQDLFRAFILVLLLVLFLMFSGNPEFPYLAEQKYLYPVYLQLCVQLAKCYR